MTKQEGEFCNKRCPKCGAMLLKNERGDEWCSRPGCGYLLKELHEKKMTVGIYLAKNILLTGKPEALE